MAGKLWERLQVSSERASAQGAICPIETDWEFLEDQGVRFVLRVVSNLARKERQKKRQRPEANPFLPFDERLFVADLSPTHVGILNKYNVLAHHLLIVTRRFQEQESLLDQADFEAIWACLADFEALAFYNCGRRAGASQRHKHLQVVPLPLAPQGPAIPIEPALEPSISNGPLEVATQLPFEHLIVRQEFAPSRPPLENARSSLELYQRLMQRLGLSEKQPYNLLTTRRWMMMVPRRREHFGSISVNTLGFAGSLLVGRMEHRRQVIEAGPLKILQEVGRPRVRRPE